MIERDIELPGLLADIAEATSLGVALTVAKHYGGTELYIPMKLGKDHQLVQILGMETALAIHAALGYGLHMIPMGAAVSIRRRREHVIKHRADMTIDALARFHGKHQRTIYRDQNVMKQPAALPLFDSKD
ncbi:MAG: hypothetical protein WD407_08750 [Rhodospirillales bacterium]